MMESVITVNKPRYKTISCDFLIGLKKKQQINKW